MYSPHPFIGHSRRCPWPIWQTLNFRDHHHLSSPLEALSGVPQQIRPTPEPPGAQISILELRECGRAPRDPKCLGGCVSLIRQAPAPRGTSIAQSGPVPGHTCSSPPPHCCQRKCQPAASATRTQQGQALSTGAARSLTTNAHSAWRPHLPPKRPAQDKHTHSAGSQAEGRPGAPVPALTLTICVTWTRAYSALNTVRIF